MTAKDELEKLDREWIEEKERHGLLRTGWCWLGIAFAFVAIGPILIGVRILRGGS